MDISIRAQDPYSRATNSIATIARKITTNVQEQVTDMLESGDMSEERARAWAIHETRRLLNKVVSTLTVEEET